MLLSQMKHEGGVAVVWREAGAAGRIVRNAGGVYDLALEAADKGRRLADVIADHGLGDAVDLARVTNQVISWRRSATRIRPICI
jgi:hypothetical protein